MKIKSLLSVAFAATCLVPSTALGVNVKTSEAGKLAACFKLDDITTVTELVVEGPMNKTDFNFIQTMTALETLDLKNAIIGGEALDGIEYPANEIPTEALANNASIKKLILPSSIESIGDNAVYKTVISDVDFSACANLKTIVKEAFYCNDYLNSINLSGLTSLETIGVNAFNTCCNKSTAQIVVDLSGCTGLKTISDYGFANIKNAGATLNLSGCTSLTSIGEGGFQNTKATKIDLSECSALSSIGKRAYSAAAAASSTITDIKLPAALQTITTEAFRNQKKVATVSVLATVPPACGTSAFYATDGVNVGTLTVPAGAKAAYEAADVWKDFGTIVEAEASLVAEFAAEKVVIRGVEDTIYVSDAAEGTIVNVYDVAGAHVASAVVAGGTTEISVAAKGIFVVKAGKDTCKVRL